MTAILIMTMLATGIAAALIPYIPKDWIERHIAMQIPADIDF
jgi:hypothetical protein